MRYLAVSRPAAAELISDRTSQSTEYEAGRTLAAVLQNPLLEPHLGGRLQLLHNDDGALLVSTAERSPDYVIFDLATCPLFSRAPSAADALLYFQKVLRFSTKIWGNLRLSATEKVLPNSTKAIVFPYPISQHTQFRISVELAPDRRRQERRPGQGHSLLVYRCGTDNGGGRNEEISLTNFRKFLDARSALRQVLDAQYPDAAGEQSAKCKVPEITSLRITSLGGTMPTQFNPYVGYERWLGILTDSQRSFVTAALDAPHKIEGPAGTGKTLCLILKAISVLHRASETGSQHSALFVTHSEATRREIQQLIETNDPWNFLNASSSLRVQALKLTTLQQLCGELLRREIHESEFLDRDAMESKQLQALYVEDAFTAVMKEDYATYRSLLSSPFDYFLTATEPVTIVEMLQHEISVVIKGRADEQLEKYRKLPRLKYGLPAETPADRGFVWTVFKRYQAQLQSTAQFDTDDIVLTAIGQLDTPIWRRRRSKEGYDSIFVDETHLFNMNELSVFHHLCRSNERYAIAFSVDRSQSVGDRGWTDEIFEQTLSPGTGVSERSEVRGIFRCSPEIVNLAFSVTSSGATLFTNFQNPLEMASSIMFTGADEEKCAVPRLLSCNSDDEMVDVALLRAEELMRELDTSRSTVALVAFSNDLLRLAEEHARAAKTAVELITRRGDSEAVRRAQRSRRCVLSTPDYIGGLEFDGVILIGVDEGRVPPTRTKECTDSSNFLTYASHNRLYVAITRAKYRVEILIVKERGPSPLLRSALASNVLQPTEA